VVGRIPKNPLASLLGNEPVKPTISRPEGRVLLFVGNRRNRILEKNVVKKRTQALAKTPFPGVEKSGRKSLDGIRLL